MTNIVSLGDLVEIKHGYAFKGEYFKDAPPGDILLTPGNFAIGGGFQWNKLKYYEGPSPEDFILSAGDLLVTMTDLSKAADTLGYPAKVPSDNNCYLHNQRLGKVVLKNDAPTSLGFIYWLLRTKEYRDEILASHTGSTVKHTSPTKIKAFRFTLPSSEKQTELSELFGTIENKIDLNRQMNETLEEMARAVFKSWFVDFDPVHAKAAGQQPVHMPPETADLFPDSFNDDGLPEGWEEKRVDDILELAYGKALKKADRRRGDVPVYGSGGITGMHDTALVDGPSIIVGRKGTVGSLYWEDGPFYPIDTTFYVRPKVELTFCYYLLQGLGLENMNTDAAVPGLNRNNAYRLPVPRSSPEICGEFDKIISLLREKIRANNEQNQTLANLRDLLLPKLMSGEIRLRDAEKAVEDA